MKTLKQFLNTNNESNKVFLGGTCNESAWRDELIPKLEDIKRPDLLDDIPDLLILKK